MSPVKKKALLENMVLKYNTLDSFEKKVFLKINQLLTKKCAQMKKILL